MFGGHTLVILAIPAGLLARQMFQMDYWVVAIPFLGILIPLGLWGQWYGFRCPRCRGNLGPLFLNNLRTNAAWRVNYCAFCGIHLDEEESADAEDNDNLVEKDDWSY
jgi:hypothetical protein